MFLFLQEIFIIGENMTKKIKVILSVFIATILMFCSACNKTPNNPNRIEPAKVFKPLELKDNGENLSEYKIVIGKDSIKSTSYAAGVMQKYIEEATGVNLPIIRDNSAESDKEIIIGKTNRVLTISIDYESLGKESYIVKNLGKKLVIAGNDRGAIYGVYAYLEALGYRFYTPSYNYIPDANDVFIAKNVDLSWTPLFNYRESMYCVTWNEEWAVSQCINSDFGRPGLKSDEKYGGYSGYIGGGKWMVHTFNLLMPGDAWFSEHPEYFALIDGARKPVQPCLSNENVYEIILNSALQKIASEPSGTMISISENDGGLYCKCDKCQENYNKYGVSGTFFRFINRIAKDIKQQYPNVMVDTLSYGMSGEVPENIEIEENVIVRVSAVMCNYHSDPEECKKYKLVGNGEDWLGDTEDRVEKWSKVTKNLSIYCYPITWANLYVALPNYAEMYHQINFFAKVGAKYVYAEGYPKNDPEFAELKAYLMAKLLKNPNMSEEEYWYYYNDFIDGYYGEAGENIKDYHKYVKKMLNEKMSLTGNHLSRTISVEDQFNFKYDRKTHSYDMTDIDYVNGLWNNAVEVTYGEQLDHVKKARVHWTYTELYSTMDNRCEYGTGEEIEELVERNRELYYDIKKYGATRKFDNAYDIGKITDFTISPKSGRWLLP